jgi:REP element-mobilizing transposase RayT
MPNHLHAIVLIDGNSIPYIRRIPNHTKLAASSQEGELMKMIANKQGWLSVIIGSVKSAVTRYANNNSIEFGWQARFHDHIIQSHITMGRIAEYISNNVKYWYSDCFNSLNLAIDRAQANHREH